MKHASYSNIVYVFVCVFVYVCVLTSCQPDQVCRESMKVGVVGELREIYYDKNLQPQLCTEWDSITAQGVGNTDTLYANTKNLKKMVLPLHSIGDSTQYILTYHNLTDTLTIGHTGTQTFVSVECGCVYEHDLLEVRHTRHWMDSVEIVSTAINRLGETNIYIWRER